MTIRILLIIAYFLCSAVPAYAVGSDFKGLLDASVSYFKPVKGAVKSVEKGVIFSDLNSSSALVKGMRLSVMREGKTFLHPMTREPLGMTEEAVGLAEAVEVGPEGSRLRILAGEAAGGDILRRSASEVRALFYQSSDVDWDISEEYYFQLKDMDRFEILDTAPGAASDEEILREAGRLNAEVAIIISAEYEPGKTILRQRLIWARDGKEFSSSKVAIGEDSVRTYKLGDEIFSPKNDLPYITFKIPFKTELIAIGDVDGDGEKELALSTGNTVRFYHVGLSLRPALEGVEIKAPHTEEHVWLEAVDVDADGRDEVIVTAINAFRAVSRVFKFGGGEFSPLFKTNTFIRFIDGGFYGQEYSGIKGYKGEVFPLSADGTRQAGVERTTVKFPKGVNLYDFNVFENPEGGKATLAYDERGHMLLYGSGGEAIWKSGGRYSMAIKTYEAGHDSEIAPKTTWSVKDRIITRGDTALAVMRTPYSTMMSGGMGFKDSRIVRLYWEGTEVMELVVAGEIPGKVIDYAFSDRKLYALVGSLGPMNIFRGRSFYITRLYVFKVKGG
jgi:hypothetical protein